MRNYVELLLGILLQSVTKTVTEHSTTLLLQSKV